MSRKVKIAGIFLIVLFIVGVFLYFRYFFTYEQKNIVQRKIETITGQNLTVTVFSYDGRVLRRWVNVRKITSSRDDNSNLTYTFFYTSDNKYVQIPTSVWYIAEEE